MQQRNLRQPVILSAVRTPVGKFQGALSSFSATELGARVVAEVTHRAAIESDTIDEVIMGNVVQAGLGQNPARQAAIRGGVTPRAAAMTTSRATTSRATTAITPAAPAAPASKTRCSTSAATSAR